MCTPIQDIVYDFRALSYACTVFFIVDNGRVFQGFRNYPAMIFGKVFECMLHDFPRTRARGREHLYILLGSSSDEDDRMIWDTITYRE